MIKISVIDKNENDFTTWWLNFVNYCESQNFCMSYDEDITKVLAEWGAINIESTVYIAFQNKQDLTLFLLRWS